jgi:RNA polymerase sigma factor (sigma-70 family)
MTEYPDWINLAKWAVTKYAKGRRDAEDIYQEAILGALKSIRRQADGGIGTCSRNQAVVKGARWAAAEYLRQGFYKRCIPEDKVVGYDEIGYDPPGESFEDEVIDKVLNEYIRNLVNTILPADQREVIERTYWNGQIETEVASAMGYSVNWIRVLKRRAKDRLAMVLDLDQQVSDR